MAIKSEFYHLPIFRMNEWAKLIFRLHFSQSNLYSGDISLLKIELKLKIYTDFKNDEFFNLDGFTNSHVHCKKN